MIRKILSKYCVLFLILTGGNARAQIFHNKANIDSVGKSAFYKIAITPALSTLMKADFSDLRVIDHSGNPIPYLMGSDITWEDSVQFTPLKIVANKINDSGQTILVILNKPNEKLDAFYIRIKNAAVSRTINLSGSDDGIKWFSIIENVDFEKRFIQDHDSFLENVSFPLSSYSFYRLTVYNGKNDPLDIISVQKARQIAHAVVNAIMQNPSTSFVRKDSNKITWLTVDNSRRYHVNNVRIRVNAPRFYKRQLDVLVDGTVAGNFLISSDTVVQLNLPLFNDSAFLIKIYNEDNAPLSISGISTAQNGENIITYLEAGKSYNLEMTSDSVEKPHFDLLSFKDSIPKDIRELGVSNVVSISMAKPVTTEVIHQYWLWPVLILVLIVLGLFTYRLVKDMSKRS